MFVYEKKLEYPVKVATPNPKLAAVIISQYGGPDGELGASLRYLSQHPSRLQPRFDVVEVYAPQGVETVLPTIYHLENAF